MGDLAEKGELVLLELGQKAMKVVFEKINLKWNAKINQKLKDQLRGRCNNLSNKQALVRTVRGEPGDNQRSPRTA